MERPAYIEEMIQRAVVDLESKADDCAKSIHRGLLYFFPEWDADQRWAFSISLSDEVQTDFWLERKPQ